jgi:hypothetical protein
MHDECASGFRKQDDAQLMNPIHPLQDEWFCRQQAEVFVVYTDMPVATRQL